MLVHDDKYNNNINNKNANNKKLNKYIRILSMGLFYGIMLIGSLLGITTWVAIKSIRYDENGDVICDERDGDHMW